MIDDGAAARVECPHADACGGCAAIGLTYGEQLDKKRARVGRAFDRYEALRGRELEPVERAEPIVGYRTRAKLAVSAGRIGLYARGTHDVVDIPSCRVLSPAVAEAVATVRALLAAPPDGTKTLFPAVLAIDAREAVDAAGTVRVLLTLVLDEARGVAEGTLHSAADAIVTRAPAIATVAVSVRARRSPQLLGKTLTVVWGEDHAPDAVSTPLGDAIEIPAVPGGFAQAHRSQAARVRDRIATIISSSGRAIGSLRVVDAYAGSGALGLTLAKAGAAVTLVESFAPAMALARRAASEAGLSERVATRTGDAEVVLGALAAEGASIDVVVVNPPRRGIAPDVRVAVARLAPSHVFYVSCEPETLARDLSHFARLGYALLPAPAALSTYDMIPLTDEVESLAHLVPASAPPPRVLFSRGDVVAVDKEPHEPTTPHPEHIGSLLARVASLDGFSRAAPLHRLDIGTSGVCLFARTPEDVASHQASLADASVRKEYRVLARGITRAKGVIQRPLRDERGVERDAVTRYRRLEVVAGHSLLAVRIETGRTHQIRKHLASLGHAVVGDQRYGHAGTNRHFEERYGLDRPFVHASRLAWGDPRGGPALEVEAPLAPDLDAVLFRLRTMVT